jgi:uncharacterized membrane protein YtjA (UPF0391 family)
MPWASVDDSPSVEELTTDIQQPAAWGGRSPSNLALLLFKRMRLVRRLQWNGEEAAKMLHWSLVFLVIALIAGALGFFGIAGTAAGIAKILFFVFLVLWLIGFLSRSRPV